MQYGGNSIQLSITKSITFYTRLLSLLSSQLIGEWAEVGERRMRPLEHKKNRYCPNLFIMAPYFSD